MFKKEKDIIAPFPEGIFVEITNVCNFECNFCPSSFSKRPKGFMQMRLFRKIVDELRKEGVIYINLWLLGEPALHPEILDFIQYAQDKDLWVAFITNGSLFLKKQGLFKKLLNDFDKIVFNVSYYGANDKTLSYTNSVELNAETYNDGIRWFLRENGKNNKRRIINIFTHLNVGNKAFNGPCNIEDIEDAVSKCNTINIIPAHNWAKTFIPKGIKLIKRKWGYCQAPWTLFAISWNGDCAICCSDYDVLNNVGNVNENLLIDIWNGKKMQKIRDAMNKNRLILPFCQQCKAIMMPSTICPDAISYLIRYYLERLTRKT